MLLESWKNRRGKRATPVLIVVLHSDGAALCGASGEEPPVHLTLDVGLVERLCREVLEQPDRHAALRYLSQALASLETNLPGIFNEGLLALHELEKGVPMRTDWLEAKRKVANIASKRDHELLTALGFRIERIDNVTSLLRGGDRRIALAVMLRESESPEIGNDRFNNFSPISYALKKADDENLPWVVLTQGSRLRLYAANSADIGIGRRGRTETWIECQISLLADKQLPYLWLLYSAEALAPQGSLEQILVESRRFAGDLADRLRERIYDYVVPTLAQGIFSERKIINPSPVHLAHTYEMALTVLFRLLFIAYAEDRDLLPYRINDAYRRRSLKQKAQELANCVVNSIPVADGDSHWQESVMLWRAIAEGNSEWGIPAYNGGLFSEDAKNSDSGASLASISLPNNIFETALRHLLVIETSEGIPGPIDFRSLGVREFGTIYEGLLESELAIADVDLELRKRKNILFYIPARKIESATVFAGDVYLHNRSGERKSSGSYYTKTFAVEHLLNGVLEPALSDHFSRLNDMNDTDAADRFFDFRVADIAMGSGHFLIGAIDRIEIRMTNYLVSRPLQRVQQELAYLRQVASMELDEASESINMEDSQLLRRMIARRCIYGTDLNVLSVQLARLAVWIHTFVRGLPLSFLDHNLVHGNALVGVGSIDEIRKLFEETAIPMFDDASNEGIDDVGMNFEETGISLFPVIDTESLLSKAANPLRRLATINDATLADIDAARNAAKEVRTAIADTENLCDLIVAQSISNNPKVTDFLFARWENRMEDQDTLAAVRIAKKSLTGLHPLHFPIAFPEVFLRDRPGFDVILGNPPWKEATVEEHAFWARHFPGLRGLSQSNQEREKACLRMERPDLVSAYEVECKKMERVRAALLGGNYPDMGTGDPDLYKAFCWRFWHLSVEEDGRIGVVLPRSAFAAKGSTMFRKEILSQSAFVDIATLKNRKGWVFDGVTPQYTIGLVCITRGTPIENSISLRGPFDSEIEFYEGIENPSIAFNCTDVLAWNDTTSLPLLPSPDSANVFAQLRKSPRLDLNPPEIVGGGGGGGGGWRARPDRELDATLQKGFMTFGEMMDNGAPGLTPNSTPQRRRTS